MKPKQSFAILWDLDGTIIDSKACHYNSWKAVFDRHGLPFSREAYERNFGRNNQTAIRSYLDFEPEPELVDAISREKEIIFRQRVAEGSRLVPGVLMWLKAARAQQLPQVVASSAPMENITSILESFDLTSYFEHCVSGADLPAKPEPDVFLLASQRVGFSASRCLVIEDSAPGVDAAKKASMACIAVATAGDEGVLKSADLVICDFTFPFDQAIRKAFEI